MGDERLTDEQFAALEEMSDGVSVKGGLLRAMIDEIRGSRARIHPSHHIDEHCIACGKSEEQLAEECQP